MKKLSSICKLCANNANFTFRTAPNSENFEDLIGGAEAYIPVCRECLLFKRKQAHQHELEKENKVLYSEISTNPSTEDKLTPLKSKDLNAALALTKNTVSLQDNVPRLISPERDVRNYAD